MSLRLAALIVVLLPMAVSNSRAADILFIGADDPPSGGDPFVLDHLDTLGHNVTYELGAETIGEDVEEFDLLIMSSTNLTSGIRDNEFDLIPQPILTWESSMVRDVPGEFYMTDDQQSGDIGTLISVADASHPIMAGIDVNDGDEVEIFTEPQNFFGLIGEVAAGATLVATGSEDEFLEDRIMIVDLPAGAEVLFAEDSDFEDGLSPGARVFIPLSDTSFEFLNEDGIKIFNNALNLALGDPCDFDGDGVLGEGDINVLSAEIRAGTNDLTFDVNGDGQVNVDDLNVFVTGEEKLHTWIGDANLDGEFNSSDLVAVFTAGKAETGDPAIWSEGDWNASGMFDSGDLVAAFVDGGYEQGPRPALAAVPEPTAIGMTTIIFALAAMSSTRRRGPTFLIRVSNGPQSGTKSSQVQADDVRRC